MNYSNNLDTHLGQRMAHMLIVLDQPVLTTETGYFQITFPGPGDDIDRIRAPETRLVVTPAIEAKLNKRQKKIVARVAAHGFVTSGWCRDHLSVVYDTIRRDLISLVELGVLESQGRGRSTRYVFKSTND